jgi:hypothetical protein
MKFLNMALFEKTGCLRHASLFAQGSLKNFSCDIAELMAKEGDAECYEFGNVGQWCWIERWITGKQV